MVQDQYRMMSQSARLIEQVREFWEAHPVAAAAIPYSLGTPEYFRYYDRLRETNESVEFSYALHEYLRFAGRSVLDVGCGNGYVLSKYAREGAQAYGIDLTGTGIDLTSKRFALHGLKGTFAQASAEDLPFPDRTFDCVCAMGVLHHTPEPARAVDEIFRVLKPNGRLILMVYHRNSAFYRFTFPLRSFVTGKSRRQLAREVDGGGNPKGDVYSKSELRRLLSNFRELELFVGLLQPEMLWPKVGKWMSTAMLRRTEPWWGWFLYAKGRKAA
jgi:2-polyprenyl-3-methyl-5-hydroxy-6-metoxy-1,4-benzoquinol methylase